MGTTIATCSGIPALPTTPPPSQTPIQLPARQLAGGGPPAAVDGASGGGDLAAPATATAPVDLSATIEQLKQLIATVEGLLQAMQGQALVEGGGGGGKTPTQVPPGQATPDQSVPDQATPDQSTPDQASGGGDTASSCACATGCTSPAG